MRPEVAAYAAMGVLPDENADEETIAVFEAALAAVRPPLSIEEARAVAFTFGNDGCYGVAWTLVHLIESAPGLRPEHLPKSDNEWIERLRQRFANAGVT